MPHMLATSIYNLFVTNPCLRTRARIVQKYSDTYTKNAVLRDRRVHKIDPAEDLQPLGIRQLEAFGNTTRRVEFNPEVFAAILLRWVNIGSDLHGRRWLLSLAGRSPGRLRTFLLYFSNRYVLTDGADGLLHWWYPQFLLPANIIRSRILDTFQKSYIHNQLDRLHKEMVNSSSEFGVIEQMLHD
jgi:hypothetical protein